MLRNARFVKYLEGDLGDNYADTVIRKLTPKERTALLDWLLKNMNSDTLGDTLADFAVEATQGQADSIVWDD